MGQTSKTLLTSLIISLFSLSAIQGIKLLNQDSPQVLGETTSIAQSGTGGIPCNVINNWQQKYCSNNPVPSIYPSPMPPITAVPTATTRPLPTGTCQAAAYISSSVPCKYDTTSITSAKYLCQDKINVVQVGDPNGLNCYSKDTLYWQALTKCSGFCQSPATNTPTPSAIKPINWLGQDGSLFSSQTMTLELNNKTYHGVSDPNTPVSTNVSTSGTNDKKLTTIWMESGDRVSMTISFNTDTVNWSISQIEAFTSSGSTISYFSNNNVFGVKKPLGQTLSISGTSTFTGWGGNTSPPKLTLTNLNVLGFSKLNIIPTPAPTLGLVRSTSCSKTNTLNFTVSGYISSPTSYYDGIHYLIKDNSTGTVYHQGWQTGGSPPQYVGVSAQGYLMDTLSGKTTSTNPNTTYTIHFVNGTSTTSVNWDNPTIATYEIPVTKCSLTN